MAKKPTQEELSAMIDRGLGSLLNPNDIEARKKTGDLPENFKMDDGFGVYRIEIGGQEYLCVTNLLCDKCQRTNGKVKKCEAHKRKKKVVIRRAKKDGDVQDDTSDREKLGGLRHVDDDEDEDDKVDGAFTPDIIMTPGIGGAIILVPVDAKNNEKAGPPAKNMNHVKGILVRGAGNIPQFIPNDRLTKAHKLRYDNYIEGELILQNGKEVFVPNGLNAAKMDDKNGGVVAKAAVADKVDQKVAEQIGKDMVVPVQVDVADNGLPVMKVLEGKPKDKETPVGMLIKTNDQVQFVQVAGKELGGGKDAKLLPCTIPQDAKKGDVIADIYLNAEGKAVAAKPGDAPKDGQVIGQVVVGNNDQLVFVAKGEDKEAAIKKVLVITPATKEKLEEAEVKLQAAVTGQSADHIAVQVQRIGSDGGAVAGGANGANGGAPNEATKPAEVRSVGFGAQQFGGSVMASANPTGGRGGAAGGAGGGANRSASPGASAGEVRSVGFGANQYGGSVMASANPTGGRGGGGYAAASGGAPKSPAYSAAAAPSKSPGGYGGGNANEVKSVGFGAQQYGGSVMAKPGGGGAGYSGGAASGGGSKAPSSGYMAAGGGGGEVRSVAYGQGGYGNSVAAKSAPTGNMKPAGNNNNNYKSTGAEAKSIGFGAPQYGGSVYMKK